MAAGRNGLLEPVSDTAHRTQACTCSAIFRCAPTEPPTAERLPVEVIYVGDSKNLNYRLFSNPHHKVDERYPERFPAAMTDLWPFPDDVRRFVESTPWTFAKTYAATWPHEYVVRRSGDAAMIVALARHIFEHGVEGRFLIAGSQVPPRRREGLLVEGCHRRRHRADQPL